MRKQQSFPTCSRFCVVNWKWSTGFGLEVYCNKNVAVFSGTAFITNIDVKGKTLLRSIKWMAALKNSAWSFTGCHYRSHWSGKCAQGAKTKHHSYRTLNSYERFIAKSYDATDMGDVGVWKLVSFWETRLRANCTVLKHIYVYKLARFVWTAKRKCKLMHTICKLNESDV